MSEELIFFTYYSLLERHLQKISVMKNKGNREKAEAVKLNEKVKSETRSVSESQNVDEPISVSKSKGRSEEVGEKQSNKKEMLLYPIIVTTIAEVLTAVIIAVGVGVTGIYGDIKSISQMATKDDIADMVTTDDIDNMVSKDDIANMATEKDIDGVKEDIGEVKDRIGVIENDYKEINNKIGVIEGRLGIYVEPNKDLIDKMNAACITYEDAYNESDNYVWEDLNKEVGRNYVTGDVYTAEDLKDEIVLLSYFDEDNNEVFCKGVYNEDNQWDGNCIINKYSNGNLIYIMNASYESGKLIAYKQVFSYTNSSDITVWAISSRTVKEKGNAGQTWTYFKEREWKKDFENEYLKAEDIINEEYFYNRMDLEMEGYYSGYTSDGYFNDENENAYMVKYTRDGHIRMFYSGAFANGQPHDMKGNASIIAFGYDEENYYYYTGQIDDISKIGNGWKKISVEEVKEKINDSGYPGSLVLYGEVV